MTTPKTITACRCGDERDHAFHMCPNPELVSGWTEQGWVPTGRFRARKNERITDAPFRAPVYDHIGELTNRDQRALAKNALRMWSAVGYETGWYGCCECDDIVRITNEPIPDACTECDCGGPWGSTWRKITSQFLVGGNWAACYEIVPSGKDKGKAKFAFGYILEVERNAWVPADSRAVTKRAKECPVA